MVTTCRLVNSLWASCITIRLNLSKCYQSIFVDLCNVTNKEGRWKCLMNNAFSSSVMKRVPFQSDWVKWFHDNLSSAKPTTQTNGSAFALKVTVDSCCANIN